ncbi:hypothetical protein [Clostridium intestinale]|uniref:Uncharacterized protein n=1 Tax=Clostridium intestinale TaxID=36845 RepID=A0A7D6VT86_9CLOT|nr:hypothetical protein [Clostridium intestinale]QLY81826.1 hypothetical protein HZF06_09645 [Clostridium intestinale]
MELLEKYILQLETDLLKPEIRQSIEKTSELLSDGFVEFCSSIWKCFDGKWKMFFHQGTLTSKF